MDSSSSDEVEEYSFETSLKTAIQIGLDLKTWEEMTPYQLAIACEGFTEMQELKFQELVTLAWFGEYYHRQKKLPKLQDELKKFQAKKSPKEMSDDEMLNIVRKLNAQFGGTVKETKVGE